MDWTRQGTKSQRAAALAVNNSISLSFQFAIDLTRLENLMEYFNKITRLNELRVYRENQAIGLNAAINDNHDHNQYGNEKEKNYKYGGVPLSYTFSKLVAEKLLMPPDHHFPVELTRCCCSH